MSLLRVSVLAACLGGVAPCAVQWWEGCALLVGAVDIRFSSGLGRARGPGRGRARAPRGCACCPAG